MLRMYRLLKNTMCSFNLTPHTRILYIRSYKRQYNDSNFILLSSSGLIHLDTDKNRLT